MPGCYVTRRELLRWTALAAAAAPAGTLLVPGTAAARAGGGGGDQVAGASLELVTLTEDRAILSWYTGIAGSRDDQGRMEPLPADAEVAWGTDPAKLDRVASSERTDTPYHRVELTGLEPGRTYWYEARSAGKPVAPTAFSLIDGNAVSTDAGPAPDAGPYRFTTPQPPPGRFLFSLVLCNDTHIGETVAGRSGDIPALAGVEQLPGRPPYPEAMLQSLVDDALAQGAHAMLVAGDISAEAEPTDLATARELFERFGERHQDWWVARGNHDRAHEGAAWASCRVGRWGGNDCFVDRFFPSGEPTYFADEILGLQVIGLDTYDRGSDGSDAGRMGDEQVAWLDEVLGADPDRPTLVFGHHPLVVEGSPYPTPPGSALDAGQAAALAARYADAPGVFLHHAGHTHRNKLSSLAAAPGVVHQEVAAVKEYPGGYALLRVHEGGYAMNFHKATSDEARAWSERSRAQVGGTWPQFALGSRVADRNVVVERDLSGLQPAPVAGSSPGAATTVPGGGSSTAGSSPAAPVVVGGGLLVLGAAAGGLVAFRRRAGGRAARPDAEADPGARPPGS